MSNSGSSTLLEGAGASRPSSLAPTALARQVQSRLAASPYLALRTIRCWEDASGLHLRGQLPSYFLKQMAQETAFQVDPQATVSNEIVVVVEVAARWRREPRPVLRRPESLRPPTRVDHEPPWWYSRPEPASPLRIPLPCVKEAVSCSS